LAGTFAFPEKEKEHDSPSIRRKMAVVGRIWTFG
jgi:hypothetical protein